LYKITQNKEDHFLEIYNTDKSNYAKLYLNQGASLQELILKNNKIIKNLSPLSYSKTYASSILFPFANRIKDGKYSYNNKSYQIDINVEEENNAMHGFIFNKTFNLIKKQENKDYASVTLEYNEIQETAGFPYKYKVVLNYILKASVLELNVRVINTDTKTFPFTIGWHPYFSSDNLHDSSVKFKSSKKIITDHRNITTDVENITPINELKIEDKKLDHCWCLKNNNITFTTPNYNLNISTSAKENYLQVYTPPKLNTIAIEPTTGVSNSFNNKIGLNTLKANDTFNIAWQLKIE